MKIIRTWRDRVDFALGLATVDFNSPSFGEGDLMNLREEFEAYFKTLPLILSSARNTQPLPGQYPKENFVRLQHKLVQLIEETARESVVNGFLEKDEELKLRLMALDNQLPFHIEVKTLPGGESQLQSQSKPVSLELFYAMGNFMGTTDSLFLFSFFVDLSRLPGQSMRMSRILICPNGNSKKCERRYFVTTKGKRYCNPKCQNNFNQKYFQRLRQLKENLRELRHRDKRSVEWIAKSDLGRKYNLTSEKIRLLIGAKGKNEKGKNGKYVRGNKKKIGGYMGTIFQRTRKNKDGVEFLDPVLYIRYYDPSKGYTVQECTRSKNRKDAERLLRSREGAKDAGEPIVAGARKVLMAELLEAVLNEYKLNNRKSLPQLQTKLNGHLKPFAGRRASGITTEDIETFKVMRREAGAEKATINRELAILRHAFRLGLENGTFAGRMPVFRTLDESDRVRQGFFEENEFLSLRGFLPEYLKPVVTFGYITGWRKEEVLSLEWHQVNSDNGIIRLEPGTTKNNKGREFHFRKNVEITALLESQKQRTDSIQRTRGIICPCVFHNNGRRIKDFRGSWAAACSKAGVSGRLFHDLRRTAVRNMIRKGIPEKVAMMISGHRSRSVFDRYNIVSQTDLEDAAAKLGTTFECNFENKGLEAGNREPVSY